MSAICLVCVLQAGEQLFGLNRRVRQARELRRTIVHRARGAAWEQPAAWPDSPNNCSVYTSCCLEQTPIRLVPGPLLRTIARRRPPGPNPNNLPRSPGAARKKRPEQQPEPRYPEQFPEPRTRGSPSPRENGVICPIMVLFIIFCYLTHII